MAICNKIFWHLKLKKKPYKKNSWRQFQIATEAEHSGPTQGCQSECQKQLNAAHPRNVVSEWHTHTAPDPLFTGMVFSSCSLISCDLPNYCN